MSVKRNNIIAKKRFGVFIAERMQPAERLHLSFLAVKPLLPLLLDRDTEPSGSVSQVQGFYPHGVFQRGPRDRRKATKSSISPGVKLEA
jgi:hypothetical protein